MSKLNPSITYPQAATQAVFAHVEAAIRARRAFEGNVNSPYHGGKLLWSAVMAYEGTWPGGESFVSFEKKAVELLSRQGETTQLRK